MTHVQKKNTHKNICDIVQRYQNRKNVPTALLFIRKKSKKGTSGRFQSPSQKQRPCYWDIHLNTQNIVMYQKCPQTKNVHIHPHLAQFLGTKQKWLRCRIKEKLPGNQRNCRKNNALLKEETKTLCHENRRRDNKGRQKGTTEGRNEIQKKKKKRTKPCGNIFKDKLRGRNSWEIYSSSPWPVDWRRPAVSRFGTDDSRFSLGDSFRDLERKKPPHTKKRKRKTKTHLPGELLKRELKETKSLLNAIAAEEPASAFGRLASSPNLSVPRWRRQLASPPISTTIKRRIIVYDCRRGFVFLVSSLHFLLTAIEDRK